MVAALAPAIAERFGTAGRVRQWPVNPSPDGSLHVGITGTRQALTREQGQSLLQVLAGLDSSTGHSRSWLHHGCCEGADAASHYIARRLAWNIHGHPGCDNRGPSPHRAHNVMATLTKRDGELPYGERNRVIASWSHRLIACPLHAEQDVLSTRSGTWMTVRMARSLIIPVTVIMPDGSVNVEGE